MIDVPDYTLILIKLNRMIKKNFGIFAFLMFGLLVGGLQTGCAQKAKSNATEFGEKFEAKNVINYDQLLTELETKAEVNDVVVKGKVDGVCQAKGCWMTIVSDSNPKAESMFVKFVDYGFFMPLDLGGGQVVMKGKAYKEETSVDELRHYAEDEGKSAEEIAKITEPVTELKFMASGVKIVK